MSLQSPGGLVGVENFQMASPICLPGTSAGVAEGWPGISLSPAWSHQQGGLGFRKESSKSTSPNLHVPFQDSACVKFANIPLAIAGHTAKPRVGEDHTKVSMLGMAHGEPPHDGPHTGHEIIYGGRKEREGMTFWLDLQFCPLSPPVSIDLC